MAKSPFGTAALPFQEQAGAFRAEDVKLIINDDDAKFMIVQSIQFQCQRTVNFLYEIGSANVYYVGNRRQGTAQMARVVGGSANFKSLVCAYGDICAPKDIELRAEAAMCKNGATGTPDAVAYILKFATLSSLGGNITAQEIVINEQLAFMFSDIDYECP
jgi:hypothetical protein